MDYSELAEAFQGIRNLGYVISHRRGPTGVGHTLERLLNLTENNFAIPDLGKAELKAHRINSGSMITLFTFNRKAWKMRPLEAIKEYGTPDINGRLGLYFTMSRSPNSAGLFLDVSETSFSVRHTSGTLIAEWQYASLAERFIKKIPALILVSALNEHRGKTEWFHYTRARLLHGTSENSLREQIQIGNILIDLRMHDYVTRARNHGTGFRVYEDKLPNIFNNIVDL